MRPRKITRGMRWKHHAPNPTIQKPLSHWFKMPPANRYRAAAMSEVMALRILDRFKPQPKGRG